MIIRFKSFYEQNFWHQILDYDPTLEDSYRIQVDVDGYPVVLDVFDTAGSDDYAMVRDTYTREGEGFICVYAMNNKASFEKVWF